MMLYLLKNTTFSTAIHRTSDTIKNIRTIFETSDTGLLDALCDVHDTEGKNDVRQKYSKWPWRKKSRLIRSIVIRLPVNKIKTPSTSLKFWRMLVIMKRFDRRESLSSVIYRVQTIACKSWSSLCDKDLKHMFFKLSTYYLNICNRCVDSFTGNLIMMLQTEQTLKNTTFSILSIASLTS